MLRRWWSTIACVLATAFSQGCNTYTTGFEVRDALTDRPIEGANIRVKYGTVLNPFKPWPETLRTDKNGFVWKTVRNAGIFVKSVEKTGYESRKFESERYWLSTTSGQKYWGIPPEPAQHVFVYRLTPLPLDVPTAPAEQPVTPPSSSTR